MSGSVTHVFDNQIRETNMTPTAVERKASFLWPLAIILIVYLALGSLFAVLIPSWQVPDEPAHYNYVRQLAQTGAYPVLMMGDYNQDLISKQIAPANARPAVSLESVKYEDHQPPLFYTLAAPVFVLFNGALIPLRLFSLVVGGLSVVFAYLAILEIFPTHPQLAAFAAAFIALLPQHLHMMAGLNNDSLSETLIALCVWLSVRYIMRWRAHEGGRGSREAGEHSPASSSVLTFSVAPLLPLAIVVGLGFLTKAQAYLTLPIVLFAILACDYKRKPFGQTLRALVLVTLIAGVIGLPWWVHSLQVYGGTDVLGLQRHNLVVVGQPTTADWIAQNGWGGLLSRMVQYTFQSFWGQFGWMSVVLDQRFYWLFGAITLTSTLLFLAWWVHSLSAWKRLHGKDATSRGESIYSPWLMLTREQTITLEMLAGLAVGTVLGFIWYNLQFVQHQGRYLYMGLIPIGTAFSLGWHFIFSRRARLQRWLWLALVVAFIALDAHLLFRVILPAMLG
jgi:hypothetical protein